MKAIELLKQNLKSTISKDHLLYIDIDESIIQQHNEAIKELEELQDAINTVIEEIDYALTKPDYAKDYLSNAKRLLMEI